MSRWQPHPRAHVHPTPVGGVPTRVLLEDIDVLRATNDELWNSKRRLEVEREQLIAERDRLQVEVVALRKERDQAVAYTGEVRTRLSARADLAKAEGVAEGRAYMAAAANLLAEVAGEREAHLAALLVQCRALASRRGHDDRHPARCIAGVAGGECRCGLDELLTRIAEALP